MAMANTSPITDYYGPRALFDPSFIPPELHGRDKELHQVTSFLRDSQEDEFAANLAICGLPGMGKSTLVGRALSDLEYGQVVDVDCRNKIVEEILGALISGTEASLLPEFSGLNVLHKGIPNLWNTLRLIVKKTVSKSKNMTIVLKSINYIEDGYFEKFCRFGKEMGVNILATWENYGFLNETKPLQGGDFRTTLRPLSCSDLHRITQDRFKFAIPFPVDDDIPRFIVDLVDEFSIRAPGICVNLVKDIYPEIKCGQATLSPNFLRDRLKFNISDPNDSAPNELDLLAEIEESDFLLKIFIDGLSTAFRKDLYLSSADLRENYAVACEMVDVDQDDREFWEFVSILKGMSILYPSKLNRDQYYLLPAPEELGRILDLIFTGL